MDLVRVETAGVQLEEVRGLFLEYARELGFSLCFQGFDQELAALPGSYGPPRGTLFLAPSRGCVAIRPLQGDAAEMKRLYIRPPFRGTGLGRTLAQAALDAARSTGFRRVRLDTIAGKMDPAIALYRSMGFREIPPYYENPLPGALYLEAELR